jgi:hypothetical protein
VVNAVSDVRSKDSSFFLGGGSSSGMKKNSGQNLICVLKALLHNVIVPYGCKTWCVAEFGGV